MTQIDAIQIAKDFARANAKIAFGDVIRVQLFLHDEMRQIDPHEADKYTALKKVWSIVFELIDSEIIPKALVVRIDDQSGIASFFKNM